MVFEDVITHKPYRGFDLIHLRQVNEVRSRWHITRPEVGRTRSYGFVTSEDAAHRHIDSLFDDEMRGMAH